MTIQEAYIRFLTKVNQNLKSTNVVASKDRFILLYNEEQIRRIEYILDKKNDDEIREINNFLITEPNISVTNILDNKFSLALPTNYLDLSSAYAKVSNSSCSDIRISLYEIKDFNSEEILADKNNAPSLKYREAPFYIGNSSLQIFTDGFSVDNAVITYYKYPQKVDIEGYIHVSNGAASRDINPEGSEAFINKVISGCAESFFRNYGDTNQIQINKDRVVNNN